MFDVFAFHSCSIQICLESTELGQLVVLLVAHVAEVSAVDMIFHHSLNKSSATEMTPQDLALGVDGLLSLKPCNFSCTPRKYNQVMAEQDSSLQKVEMYQN